MSKLLLLTLNEQEEKVIDKIIAAISDCISLEAFRLSPSLLRECLFRDWK